MKYDKDSEKKQIKTAFRVLLLMHSMTINKFAAKFKLDPQKVYQAVNANAIDHDKIQEFIHLVDKTQFLQSVNSKMVICKKL